jgi:hypothetical protein
MSDMRRREFITLLGVSPLAGEAGSGTAVYRWLSNFSLCGTP